MAHDPTLGPTSVEGHPTAGQGRFKDGGGQLDQMIEVLGAAGRFRELHEGLRGRALGMQLGHALGHLCDQACPFGLEGRNLELLMPILLLEGDCGGGQLVQEIGPPAGQGDLGAQELTLYRVKTRASRKASTRTPTAWPSNRGTTALAAATWPPVCTSRSG